MVWKKWGIWTPTEPIDAFKYIRFYFLSLFVLFSGTRNVCSIRSYHLVWVLFDNFILFMILISIRVLNIHRFSIEINVRRSSRWRRTRTSSKKREQEMPKFTWQHLLRIYLVSRVTMRRKNERTNKRATSVRSSILVEARNSRGFWLPVLHTTIHYIKCFFFICRVRSQKILLNLIWWESRSITRSHIAIFMWFTICRKCSNFASQTV